MNLTNTWCAGVLLSSLALLAVANDVQAQNWQDPSVNNNDADWQQRMLKRPPQQQWTAVQHPSNQSQPPVQYQQSAVQHQQSGVQYQQTARRNAFDTVSAQRSTAGANRQHIRQVSDEEVIEPGTTQFEPMAAEGTFAPPSGCASCGGGGCDSCEPCGDGCGAPCGECCDFGWEVFDGSCGPWLRGLSVFAGVDGFKGPIDRGSNGNFGLNEGLNLARPLGDPWGCGYQIGANFVQSDFSGTPFAGNTDKGYRRQYFATAGIFQRATACGGFQWGVAYDYLHDIYYQTADLQQIRSETSFVLNETYDIGYYGAYGVSNSQARVWDGFMDPTDMFVGFVRRRFENGGDGRIWFGATGHGDGLLGVDLWVPLGRSLALENRINYMIPKDGRDTTAQTRESWGLVIQLVWYPGQNAKCQQQNPYRPMFNVADNSLFMVDRMANGR